MMRPNRQHILVTRALSARHVEFARNLGLEPVVQPALEFVFPDYWDGVLKVINEHRKSEWVFTSANGVKALEALMNAGLQVRPETRLFAVGGKTQEALEKLGLESKIPGTEDGKHLAELIIEQGKVHSVLHFHGNLSRDEMMDRLVAEGIEVAGMEVYKTIIHPVHMPDKPVSGILFCSPSAVEGFSRGEGFARDLPPLFAIGPTTAKALNEESGQSVEIARQPDMELLLRTAAHYIFKKA